VEAFLQWKFSSPIKADLNFALDQANMKPLAPYIAQFAYLRLDDGKLSIDGRIKLNEPDPSKKMEISFEANTKIDDLKLYDTKTNERFLEWKSLAISGISGQLEPMQINISEVNLSGLYSRIAIAEDKSFNLVKVLKESPVVVDSGKTSDTLFVTSTQTEKTSTEFKYDIGKIKIENSEMYFSDFSLPLKFASKIHQLNGEVTGFSSENPLGAEIKMEGTVDEYDLQKLMVKWIRLIQLLIQISK
jgi:hypothetical protein